MNILAKASYVRVSPRKLELLVRQVKTLTPTEAVTRLQFTPKSGAESLRKLIISAMANAKQQNVATSGLRFAKIEVLPGGSMKRFRAVSRGMAHTYKKRMSHVNVILTEKKVQTQKEENVQVQMTNTKSNPKSK